MHKGRNKIDMRSGLGCTVIMFLILSLSSGWLPYNGKLALQPDISLCMLKVNSLAVHVPDKIVPILLIPGKIRILSWIIWCLLGIVLSPITQPSLTACNKFVQSPTNTDVWKLSSDTNRSKIFKLVVLICVLHMTITDHSPVIIWSFCCSLI